MVEAARTILNARSPIKLSLPARVVAIMVMLIYICSCCTIPWLVHYLGHICLSGHKTLCCPSSFSRTNCEYTYCIGYALQLHLLTMYWKATGREQVIFETIFSITIRTIYTISDQLLSVSLCVRWESLKCPYQTRQELVASATPVARFFAVIPRSPNKVWYVPAVCDLDTVEHDQSC